MFFALLMLSILADEPAPVFPVAPVPAIASDPPAPKTIDRIGADELLVLALPSRIALVAVPDGAVEIVETEQASGASTTIRGKFAGGGGKTERRRFDQAWLYEITPKTTGSVELIAIPIGLTDPQQIQRQKLELSVSPAPPLPVVPTPPGPVPPGPSPSEFRVLLLTDQADSVTAQAAASAVPVVQWLDANCVQSGGRAEWRRYDRTVMETDADDAPPVFAKLWKEIRPKLPDGPQAVVARGSQVTIVEIEDAQQLLDALKELKAKP